MKRLLLAGIVSLLLLAGVLILASVFVDTSSTADMRLVRGRGLLSDENYLGALEAFREVVASRPDDREAHSYLGLTYLRLHLYQSAIREFERAKGWSSRRAHPWTGLAHAYLGLDEPARALEHAERAASLDENAVEAWTVLGWTHWVQKNYGKAEEAGLKTLELDPRNLDATELLLRVYFDQNDPEQFEVLRNRVSEWTRPLEDLVVAFFVRQGRFARAHEEKLRQQRAALERSTLETELAIERDPAQGRLYPPLVRNLVAVGRAGDAIHYARLYRGGASLNFEIAKALDMDNRRGEATQYYRRASDELLHKLSAEVALAVLTGDIRRWEEAFRAERVEKDYWILRHLEDIAETAPPRVRAFIWRYAGIYDAHFYNKAVEDALEALELDRADLNALITTAVAYHRLGNIYDARRYLEMARDQYPRHAEPLRRLAVLGLGDTRPEESLELLEESLELDPGHAGTLYNIGWIHDQLGDARRAAAFYERAIRASALSFEAMNNLALIYGEAGQQDRAYRLLLRAIETDPASEAGYFNLGNYYWRQRGLEACARAVRSRP